MQDVQPAAAGNQPEKTGVAGDDGDVAAVEYRQQRLDRRFRVEPVELADHRGRHRIAETGLVAADVQPHVGLFDDGGQLVVFITGSCKMSYSFVRW
jgi:hypothetical protein